MTLTASQVKAIGQELNKLRQPKITLDGNRTLTVREAIFALAPTLERMKQRGFETQEIIQKLQEKGIEIKSATLARYLNEYKRAADKKAETKADKKAKADNIKNKTNPSPKPEPSPAHSWGSFEIRPDIPHIPEGEL